MNIFLPLWRNIKLLFSRTTPGYLKVVAVCCILYILSPYDLLPDWILGPGFIDDITVLYLTFSFISRRLKALKEESRRDT